FLEYGSDGTDWQHINKNHIQEMVQETEMPGSQIHGVSTVPPYQPGEMTVDTIYPEFAAHILGVVYYIRRL
ncbi:hypothetical protein HispidOSU_017919, partial [Sigmodon hispidus]